MGGLDKNRFNVEGNLDALSRKEMISKIDDGFDDDHAKYLSTELGCSSRSNNSDYDDDSSNASDGPDGDVDSTSSGSDDGCDSSASGSSDDGGSDSSNGDDDDDDDDDDGDANGDEEEDEGQEDTHLKMFLENLKPDGTSYILKRDGKADLKFEGLDEDGDGSCEFDDNVVDQEEVRNDCESEWRRREGNDLDGRSGGGKGKGILRKDGMGCSRDVKENGNVGRRAKGVKNGGKKQTFVDNGENVLVEEVDVVPGKRGGKTGKNVESGKDCLVGNGDCRPVKRREGDVKKVEKKQTFMVNKKYRSVEQVDLTKVKRRGKNVDKKSVVEVDSDSSVEEVDIRLHGTRFLRNVKENGKLKRKAKNVENVKKQKMECERNNVVEDVNLRPDCRRFPRNVKENGELERRAKDVKKEKSYKENERDSSMGELGLRSKKQGKVSDQRKSCLSEKISAPYTDPDYKMFFAHSEIEGDDLVYNYNGKRVKFGEDDNKSLSNCEVDVLDTAPDCIQSNYAPTLNYNTHMEEDDLQCLGSCSAAENPEFRKAVMDVLRKPYNENEYKRLWDDVKLRKLTERHVDMRSGNTSFQQTTMGKSYLDHYDDLKKQFDAFKDDKPKRLNILRGFFFYLKRMADDGKFKPWLDDSCLAIIPRTS